jgi:c-di-GMP-binding flagellar brake protein YcgR
MFKPRYTRVRPAREEPVQVQIEGPGLLEILQARDVSRSGFSLLLSKPAPAGFAIEDELDLVVTLPGRPPFRARAEIRHLSEYLGEALLGIELVEVAEAQRDQLEAYVVSRLRAERGSAWSRCSAAPRRAARS